MSGKWPDLGEDENGQFKDPTDDEFWYFHRGDHWAKEAKKRDKARDDIGDFKLAFQGSQIMRDISKYLVNCGWTHEDIRRELKPSQEGIEMSVGRGSYPWGSEEYEKWRKIAWEDMKRNSQLVRRAIAGAYNCNSYTYFRPEATYNNTKYLNPLATILAVRPEDRRISALRMIQNYGIELNDALKEQMRRGIAGARTEPGNAPGWGVHLDEGLLKSIVDTPST